MGFYIVITEQLDTPVSILFISLTFFYCILIISGEPPQPAPLFLIPIICILMLTTIILFVLSSYMTDRPGWGRNIEVADFHFSQSGSHNQLTMHLQAWGNKLMVALCLKPPQQPTVVDATPREDGEPFLNRSIRNQTPTAPSRAYGSTGGFLG